MHGQVNSSDVTTRCHGYSDHCWSQFHWVHLPVWRLTSDQTIISFNDAAQEEDEVNLKELDDELKKQKQRQVRCSHDGIV